MARPSAIRPISEQRNFVRLMVYGDPGVGKSAFAGTSPKCLILANDPEEMISAAARGSKAEVWICPDYTELTEAFEWVQHEGYKEYEWVWIDNGTLMQDQGMDQIMAEMHIKRPDRSPWIPDRPEYLLNQNMYMDLIRRFKSLPIHFGMTAHVMQSEDLIGNVLYQPLFHGQQGQYSQKICGYMNIIGHYTTKEGKDGKHERVMYLDSRDNFVAKDRYDALGARMIDPSIPKMMALIKQKLPTVGKPTTAPVKKVAAPTKVTAAKKTAAKKSAAKSIAATKKKAG